MGIFGISFKSKDRSEVVLKESSNPRSPTPANASTGISIRDVSEYMGLFSPNFVTENFINVYTTIGEVYFPINYIVSRIKSGNFMLKRVKDDSVVFDNQEINNFLSKPNPIFDFDEITGMFFTYRFVAGDAYLLASVPDNFGKVKDLWRWCENYWVLPSDNVSIKTPLCRIPLFSSFKKKEIIKSYDVTSPLGVISFDPNLILHDKETNIRFDQNYLKGQSRLLTQKYTISNLVAVYEARNVIYVKRGSLGMLISEKYDATGSIPMTQKEKKDIRDEYEKNFGLTNEKSLMSIINTPSKFVRMNMSISELQPFKETLNDACQIAGIYGIPSVLIPREDQSTFSNQENAEVAVYTGTVIPEAKRYCKMLTSFLGLENSGLYIDVDFSHIEVLQKREKEKSSSKKLISEKCKAEFYNGVITLNDWRSQIGESRIDNSLYDKLILFMTDQELDKIRNILSLSSKQVQTSR